MEIPGQKDHLIGIANGATLVGLEVEVVVVTTCSQFILNQFMLKLSTSNLFTMRSRFISSRFISNRFIHIHTTVRAVQPVEEVILAHYHTVRVHLPVPVPATAMVMGEHVNCMDL
jgi:hypothetical protein